MFQPNYEFLLEYLANMGSKMTCCLVLVDLVECSQKTRLDNKCFSLDHFSPFRGQIVAWAGYNRNPGWPDGCPARHQLVYCLHLSLELMDVTVMVHALIIPT